MTVNPFIVFPWQRPFLPDLKDFLTEAGNGHAERCLIVTPNRRPWRYLLGLFAKDKKPGLLPRMLTISELVQAWRALLPGSPSRLANAFDQVALLYDALQGLAEDDSSVPGRLSQMKLEEFLPWGMRLASILEEFAVENVRPTDLAHFEGELSDTAASILQALGRINDAFQAGLAERGWTSVGQMHQELCAQAGSIPREFMPSPERPLVIAGFYRLSGSHEIILKSLWKAGASVCLHSDPALAEPALANGDAPHRACSLHKKWLAKWGAGAKLSGPISREELERHPETGFFSGYDLHSQLDELTRLLGEEKRQTGSTAIILGKSDTLMPTLHQLADKNLNISMGYPLERSSVANLLNLVLDIQESRSESGRYHSRDILRLLDHPALGLRGEAWKSPLAVALRKERWRVACLGKLWEKPAEAEPDQAPLAAFYELFLTDAEKVSNLEGLADLLERICAFLAGDSPEQMAEKHVLEAEAMGRLQEELFPLLRNSALARSDFSLSALHGLFTQALGQMRIPFAPDPMLGLQLIGMLESRLLHFDRVLILDATDDVLPGSQASDPLMPDFLKTLVGLPDNQAREESAAHNLYRLCAGARRVDFLWQEGTGQTDFYDSKKVRSRYVEQFLWEKEKEQPDLLDAAPGQGLVRRPPASHPKILRSRIEPIKRTEALDAAIRAWLESPVSPTPLDHYLYCPRGFVLQHIMHLRSGEAGASGLAENPYIRTGELVHAVLKDLFERVGPQIPGGKEWAETVQGLLHESCRRQEKELKLERFLPLHHLLILRRTVPERIMEYLEQLEGPFSIHGLEMALEGSLQLSGRSIRLEGKADRLDRRKDGIWIIDYKTGKEAPTNDPGLWLNNDFFRSAEMAMAGADAAALDASFTDLSERLSSIQLPAYLVMLSQEPDCADGKVRPANAAWVHLLSKGNYEIPLLAEASPEDLPGLVANCASAVGLVVEHISRAENFAGPSDESKCKRCDWKRLCARS